MNPLVDHDQIHVAEVLEGLARGLREGRVRASYSLWQREADSLNYPSYAEH